MDEQKRKGWELAIRAGQTASVRAELREITRRRVPRAEVAELAQIAWRSGLPYLGLRLLTRFVRPRSRSPEEASLEEKAEYAACLIRIGALGEATELLDSLDPARAPRVLLYRAGALVAQFRYEETIPLLRQYCSSSGVSVYQKLIAKVNLAAAFVFLRDEAKATPFLRDLLHEVSVRRLPLLTANTLELMSEHAILNRRFRDAEKGLKSADELIGASETVYAFLVTKWSLVLQYMSGKSDSLDALRKLATQRRHSQTLRDCDRFTALKEKNARVATHLVFGTPYESYRKRLLDDFVRWYQPPETYLWSPGPRGGGAPVVDLFSGEVSFSDGKTLEGFKRGQFAHRLLVILSSDFYRPFRIPELHHLLHPGEHFHPESSPLRFHQTARALRLAIEAAKLPLKLELRAGGARLRAEGPVKIQISRSHSAGKPAAFEVEKLRERFLKESFSTQQAVSILEASRRTVQRILQSATREGELLRTGMKGYTRYRFREPQS